LDSEEVPLKREVLFRESRFKVWKFIEGRIHSGNFDPDSCGFVITAATEDESWDWDIEEPLYRGPHAVEVSLTAEQLDKQGEAFAKRLMRKTF
jgi:hypothetical protein